MLILKDACLNNGKKDNLLNVEYDFGIHKFDYEGKNIFNFLTLKNQYLSHGSFLIDDLIIIGEEAKTSKLLAFKINSQVINLICVFHLTDEFKSHLFQSFKNALLSLKDLPLNSIEDKQNKIKSIFEQVNNFKPLYITIDFNDQTNFVYYNQINALIDFLTIRYVFILNKKIESDIKENALVEEEIINNIQTFATNTLTGISAVDIKESVKEENALPFEKEFEKFYSIDTSFKSSNVSNPTKENKIPNKSDKKNKIKEIGSFTILLFKNINLYYLFIFVFSLFVGLGAFCCIYLIRTEHFSVGIILTILFLLFLFVNSYIYGSTYAGVRKHLNANYKKTLFIISFALFTLLGFAASYGACYLLDSINAFISMDEFVFDDYLVALIVLPVQLILCLFSPLIARIYIKWHKFKIKHFGKKE